MVSTQPFLNHSITGARYSGFSFLYQVQEDLQQEWTKHYNAQVGTVHLEFHLFKKFWGKSLKDLHCCYSNSKTAAHLQGNLVTVCQSLHWEVKDTTTMATLLSIMTATKAGQKQNQNQGQGQKLGSYALKWKEYKWYSLSSCGVNLTHSSSRCLRHKKVHPESQTLDEVEPPSHQTSSRHTQLKAPGGVHFLHYICPPGSGAMDLAATNNFLPLHYQGGAHHQTPQDLHQVGCANGSTME
eukprot:jgi/Psemu1/12374/gm1.12374_g